MALGIKEPINFCSLKDGKVEVYRGKDEAGNKKIEKYDYIIGMIAEITVRDWEYQGEPMKSWQIKMVDGKDVYVLSLNYSAGFTRGLFNSLANCDLTKQVLISCYVKDDWNNPSVSQSYELVKWKYPTMPKTKKVMVGTKEVVDDTEAMEWMLGVVSEIKGRIPKIARPETTTPEDATVKAAEEVFEAKAELTAADVKPVDYPEDKKDINKDIPSDLPWETPLPLDKK